MQATGWGWAIGKRYCPLILVFIKRSFNPDPEKFQNYNSKLQLIVLKWGAYTNKVHHISSNESKAISTEQSEAFKVPKGGLRFRTRHLWSKRKKTSHNLCRKQKVSVPNSDIFIDLILLTFLNPSLTKSKDLRKFDDWRNTEKRLCSSGSQTPLILSCLRNFQRVREIAVGRMSKFRGR